MVVDPLALCVCLTADRHYMTERAISSFRSQTYANKTMLVLDTGEVRCPIMRSYGVHSEYYPGLRIDRKPIGALRNLANAFALPRMVNADVICHFDSDDLSHPNRIAEQVELLQSSGADVVGYNQAVFWDARAGEAWIYTGAAHHPLGASLCYWRRTWEAHKFDDRKARGEDTDFLRRIGHRKIKSASAVIEDAPRLICTVHGANTQQHVYDGLFKRGDLEMRRVPEWDSAVRKALEAA